MLRIGLGFQVATGTSKYRIIVGIRVAVGTDAVGIAMRHWEPRVIKRRTRPRSRCMARGAGGGEAG